MSRTSSGIGIQRSRLTSCLISSIGKSGARSCGPMGCFVQGCSTGGAGVLRSAWMLYHFDGMSFSSRRNFVRFLSVVLAAMPTSFEASPRRDPRKVRSRYERAAALSTEGGCYTAVEEEAMTRTLRLPRADGALTPYTLTGSAAVAPSSGPIRSRVGFAAVHVVADPLAAINPTLEVALDWEATLAYRRYLWSLGLAVAEAMDTSQRGMGFDWETARELIKRTVAEALLAIVSEHAARIDGVKISLLDQRREIAMRRRFPRGVRMYTGDDFDYPATIRGDGERASDALLGIFDVIAPAAAAALKALDASDLARYEAILGPTLPLARHVFGAPTRFYKTGVVFAAYLNGHQSHFRMVGGMESARSVVHLAAQLVLMDRAGLLRDPDLAATRMGRVLAVAGIE